MRFTAGDVMTFNYSRGALVRLLAGLVVIGSLTACGGSSSDNSPAPLSISTSSLPMGQVDTAYSVTLAAKGGTPPYQWALASGALPAGLTLAASGTITGTPTAAANAAIGVKVTDSGSPAQSSTRTLTLVVVPPLVVNTKSLPAGVVGVAYAASLSASGGTPPYKW